MGFPKKQRRKFETPKKPYDKNRLENEKKIKQNFGLRRKHEIWRTESILRAFKRRARELQAVHNEEMKKALFDKLNSTGLGCSSLEDVLELSSDDIFSRRLQTILYKKGLASSIHHSRQLIVHGHVSIDGKRMVWPSYLVKRGEEEKIELDPKVIRKEVVK
jgi:small subunit ribosomal protein S4